MTKINNNYHVTKDGTIKKNPHRNSKMQMMALDIERFIRKHGLDTDIAIYFDNKRWKYDSSGNKTIQTGIKASEYFEYANDKTLSMSFEGEFYNVVNGYNAYTWELEEKFSKILHKYGYYYELGNAWNLSVYKE